MRRERYFAERVAAVDEQPALWGDRVSDALQGDLAGFRVASVEGADPDREGEVEGFFVCV